MNETIEVFKALYKELFDENQNLKICGRDKCRQLIILAKNIKDDDFGNIKHGMLNIDKIKDLYIELTKDNN